LVIPRTLDTRRLRNGFSLLFGSSRKIYGTRDGWEWTLNRDTGIERVSTMLSCLQWQLTHLGFPVPWFSLETVERSRLWGSPVKPPDQTKTFILGLCLPDVIVLCLCLCLCHREAGCPLNPRYDTGSGE
jgi:hypothetical protein